LILADKIEKGDVFSVARIAGIRTHSYVPSAEHHFG
jgi:molybdenum cofactor biosynthesis enzyme